MTRSIIFIYTILCPLLCVAQDEKTVLKTISETIDLNYRPTKSVKLASLSFLKFSDNEYGVKIFFKAPELIASQIITQNNNSLNLTLTNHKYIEFTKRFEDTAFNLMDGTNSWVAYYIISKTDFELFKSEEIISLFNKSGDNPISLKGKIKT